MTGIFPETPAELLRWQKAARERHRKRAIALFCRLYWRPIFNVLRARHLDHDEAEDLTQGFFLYFITSETGRIDPTKGRFRDFLTGALNHYLSGVQRRNEAAKRGGARIIVSLDDSVDETASLPTATDLALRGDRAWADRLLASVADRIAREYAREGRWEIFCLLRAHLTGEEPPTYEKVAARLRRDPVTLRSDVKRLRQQFREVLRDELRKRVGPEHVEDELDALRDILRRK